MGERIEAHAGAPAASGPPTTQGCKDALAVPGAGRKGGGPSACVRDGISGCDNTSSAHACSCALLAHEPPADVLGVLGSRAVTLAASARSG